MNPLSFLLSASLFFNLIVQHSSFNNSCCIQQKYTEWTVSDFILNKTKDVQIIGSPVVVNSKYGKAVEFNGSTDGIFVEDMPLAGLDQFTIEVIMRPDTGGNFEQRLFHCGTIKNSRVLLELRATKTDWYFDGFIKSGDERKALIDSSLLHPLRKWYHAAFVVNRGKLSTYINGIKELEGNIVLTPLNEGITSIGVRQNKQSWFKGVIFKIRITPNALIPAKFLKYK